MKLGSLIRHDFILTGNRFKTHMEAADALIDLFVRKESLPVSAAEAKRIVREREKLGGTIMPPGVALPHGRLQGYHDLMIGIWVPETPLETDQGPVKVLILSFLTEQGSELYLKVLASIGKSLSKPGYIDTLPGMSAHQIHEELQSVDIQEEVTISDIMTPNPVTCRPETSLRELIDIFVGENLSFLPVVDSGNRPVGEVAVKDVLAAGVPDYARRLGNLEFVKNLEPFRVLIRDDMKIKVKDIMRPPTRSLEVGSSIIQAAMLITTKGYRHIPVLDKGKIAGILSETDILRKVLRGEIWHN